MGHCFAVVITSSSFPSFKLVNLFAGCRSKCLLLLAVTFGVLAGGLYGQILVTRADGDLTTIGGWDFNGGNAPTVTSVNARYDQEFGVYYTSGIAPSPGNVNYGTVYFTGSNGGTFASARALASSNAPAYDLLSTVGLFVSNNSLGDNQAINPRSILLSSNTVLDNARASFKINTLNANNAFDNISVAYSARNQGADFATVSWSYSLDGVNFTSIAGTADQINPSGAAYSVFGADFSSISAINGQSNVWFGLDYLENSLTASVFIDNLVFYGIASFTGPTSLAYWMGSTGAWTVATTPTNWRDSVGGTTQGVWATAGAEATFGGTAGTVTVDNTAGAVKITGAKFLVSGYTVAGADLTTTTPSSALQVGDGTAASSAMTATISAAVIGTGGINKTDLGTLVLSGANTYTAGTTITAGTLQVGAGGTTGSIIGNVANSGTLAFNRSDAIDFSGVISGTGAVTQLGSGTTSLSGANTYSGGTTISTGTLQLGTGGTTGSITGNVTNNATLAFNRSDAIDFGGVISGTGAVTQVGSGTTTLSAANTYTGGTTISTGTLQLGNGSTTGSIAGNVTNNATLAFNRSDALTFGGVISGTGAIAQTGSGTTSLTGANTYSGGTTISVGTLQLGTGGTTGSIAGNVVNNATLAFNRSDALSLGGIISGTGAVTKSGAGTTTLTGANTYTGATTVGAGTLLINGNQSGATGLTTVASGGTLGGTGTVGAVTVANGGTLRGQAGQLFTTGNLTFGATSNLNVSLGAPSTTGLIQVNGALTLDGLLNATDAGSFGPGIYRLMNYTGAFTDNGLTIGAAPVSATDLAIQTSVANQVNLVFTATAANFWGGGAGTWTANNTSTAWTNFNGSVNTFWSPQFAIFQNTLGTVTVDNTAGPVLFTGAQFAVNGYTVAGAALTSNTAGTILRVGDGTSGGSSMTATISAPLAGTADIIKTDFGTLVLSGANTYTGGTTISNGTLQLGAGGTSGSITGNVTNNATLAFNRSDAVSFGGVISGTGAVTQTGSGTTSLTAVNTYSGGTTISAGTLQLGNGGTTGSLAGDVVNNATFAFNRSNALSVGGVISGTGAVAQSGSGTTSLTGANTYSGGTTISAGTLQLGTGGTTGSITGNVSNNATLGFNRNDALAFGGVISGSGAVAQSGSGTTTLTGANTYSGGTSISAGTLQLGNAGTTGSLAGNVANNATLAFKRSNALTFGGVISGTGAVVQSGSGTTTLTGANTYTGATTVSSGTLLINGNQVAANGAVTVASGATLSGTGTTGGTVTVQNGGILSGAAGSLFTIGGLNLNSTSQLNVALGAPSTTGLFQINGSLTLDGIFNVTNAGGFGPGVYRLMNYTGALTDNGLTAGTVPSGINAADLAIQTSVANQVNVVLNAAARNFWGGGSGTWTADAGSTAWTTSNGSGSGSWAPAFAIFQNTAGTVTVDNAAGAVAFTGAHFMRTGYSVTGGALSTSTANTILRVGDGTAGSASMGATISSAITGTGGVEKTDFGTLTLAGANNYSGTTTVSSGTLLINGNQSAATGAVSVASGARLGGTGQIGGAVTIQNGGILSGQTGGILTMAGLTLNNTSNLNLALGAATPSTLFQVNGNLTLDGVMNVTNVGGFGQGLYRLFNYTGALTNNGLNFGTLPTGVLNSALTLQTSTAQQVNLLYLNGNSSLPMWTGGSGVWSASPSQSSWSSGTGVSGGWRPGLAIFQGTPGNVTVDTTGGAVIVDGIQFFVDGYTVSGGPLTVNFANATIRVGDGTALGTTMKATISAPIIGTGGLTVNDYGTLVLSGTNTYTGGTTISYGGVVQAAADSALGAASGRLTMNGGMLRTSDGFASSRPIFVVEAGGTIDVGTGKAAFSGAINGAGIFSKTGAGLLTLSGANGFSGPTTIKQGGILLNNSSLSATTVMPGALLGGTGTIRGNLTNNGLLSPGASPGTITVAGNYTQSANAGYTVELASPTSFDKLVVAGTASLDGTLTVVPLSTFSVKGGQSYRILESAGGVQGKFATVNSPYGNVSPMLRFETLYGTNDVTLRFNQLSFAGVAQTPNQISVGQTVDRAIAGSKINLLQDALNQQPTVAGVNQALEELSPQRYERWFDQAVYHAGANVRAVENRLAMATIEKQRSLWMEIVRRVSQHEASGESRSGEVSSDGLLVGGDMTVLADFRLGAVFGYNDELMELDAAGSTTKSERFSAALYGRWEMSPVFLEGMIGASYAKLDSHRTISIPGYQRSTETSTDSGDRYISLRAGYPRDFGALEVTPFLAVQHVSWDADESSEFGAGEADLTLLNQAEDSLTTRVGVTVAWQYTGKKVTLSPKLSLAWRHEFNGSARSIAAELGGNPFTVQSRLPMKDGIVADVGVDAAFSSRLTAYARLSAEWSTTAKRALEARAGVEYRF